VDDIITINPEENTTNRFQSLLCQVCIRKGESNLQITEVSNYTYSIYNAVARYERQHQYFALNPQIP
jgi:hypothetical protein